MGMFDFIVDIPKNVFGGALDIATGFFGNEAIDKKNATTAYNRSVSSTSTAWDREKEGATTAYQRSENAAKTAFDRSYNAYKERYQTTVKDLKLAGLNPILAATGLGGTSAPTATSAQAYQARAPQAQSFQAKGRPYESTKSGLNLSMQTKAIASANKDRQQVKESIQKIVNLRSEKKLITAKEKNVLEHTLNLEKDWWIKVQQFHKITLEGYKIGAETKNIIAKRKVIVAQAKTLMAQLRQIQKVTNAYDGPIGDILGYVKAILSAMGINVGILTGMGRK